MLSFDITDRNIRIVKGVEGNGKIKISSAATLNLEEEVIVNGHVKDVPRVATLINGILKKSKMADKEAIVSISSNLTIFKELTIQKTKSSEFSKAVKQQMQSTLNIDDTYCVSYVIVGEAEGESNDMVKVLATACPNEIVNCYREVFKMLGIALKSVMIGCNCITKVLLADTKIKAKMPLLAVQIDNNFISLNLYEHGQLSFTRFASIDASDYGNSEDYVFEAVNENIYRMLQFHRTRNTGETIENVIFYGDTHEYVRLTDELEKLELNTSLINVPPQIHGHENLEFSLYANAIGAMFKRNKETEKINLLEIDGGVVAKAKAASGGNYTAAMLAVVAGTAIIVGGIWGGLAIHDKGIENKIESYQADIDSPETAKKLQLHTRLLDMKTKVDNYSVIINNANDALKSQPVILGEKYDKLDEVISSTADKLGVGEAKIVSPQYSSGVLTFDVLCSAVTEPSQKIPAEFVDNLMKEDEVVDVRYSNYSVVETGQQTDAEGNVISEGEKKVNFSLVVTLKGRESAYHAPDANKEATEGTEAE